jgi:hypothetical protein
MLPTYVVFSIALGEAWILQDPSRHSYALQQLDQVWPLAGTGVLLIALGSWLACGLLVHSRVVAATALATGAVAYFLLGVIFVYDAGYQPTDTFPFFRAGVPEASLSAPFWPWFVMVAHLASLLSLTRDEVGDFRERSRR